MIAAGCVHQFAELQQLEQAADGLFPPERLPDLAPTSDQVLQRALDQGLLWCAELDNRLCGFAFAEPHDAWLHLQQVAVHPQFGRRGLGRSLVGKVMDCARERSLSGVDLTTFADFPWNAPFYRSLGFVECESPEGFLADQLNDQRLAGMTNRIAMAWRV